MNAQKKTERQRGVIGICVAVLMGVGTVFGGPVGSVYNPADYASLGALDLGEATGTLTINTESGSVGWSGSGETSVPAGSGTTAANASGQVNMRMSGTSGGSPSATSFRQRATATTTGSAAISRVAARRPVCLSAASSMSGAVATAAPDTARSTCWRPRLRLARF